VDRAIRKGLNESWFREVNERLEQRSTAGTSVDETFAVLCECDREDCGERITIALGTYEQVRADPRAFIVLTSHVDSKHERVVTSSDEYTVVEKVGEAGLVAEIENPRGGQGPDA
jgi:hypothetical protein